MEPPQIPVRSYTSSPKIPVSSASLPPSPPPAQKNRSQNPWLRIAEAFAPDLVLISAGFDAAPGDPLGRWVARIQGPLL